MCSIRERRADAAIARIFIAVVFHWPASAVCTWLARTGRKWRRSRRFPTPCRWNTAIRQLTMGEHPSRSNTSLDHESACCDREHPATERSPWQRLRHRQQSHYVYTYYVCSRLSNVLNTIVYTGWLRCTVVERRSLAGELSHAWPVSDVYVTTYVGKTIEPIDGQII